MSVYNESSMYNGQDPIDTTVYHDSTLSGDGSLADPLKVSITSKVTPGDKTHVPTPDAVIEAFPDRINGIGVATTETSLTGATPTYIKLASVPLHSVSSDSFNYSLTFLLNDPYFQSSVMFFVGYETKYQRTSVYELCGEVSTSVSILYGATVQLRKSSSEMEVWLKVTKGWDANADFSLHYQVIQNSLIQKDSLGNFVVSCNPWDVSYESKLTIETTEPSSTVVDFRDVKDIGDLVLGNINTVPASKLPNASTTDSGIVVLTDSVTSGDNTKVPTANAVYNFVNPLYVKKIHSFSVDTPGYYKLARLVFPDSMAAYGGVSLAVTWRSVYTQSGSGILSISFAENGISTVWGRVLITSSRGVDHLKDELFFAARRLSAFEYEILCYSKDYQMVSFSLLSGNVSLFEAVDSATASSGDNIQVLRYSVPTVTDYFPT